MNVAHLLHLVGRATRYASTRSYMYLPFSVVIIVLRKHMVDLLAQIVRVLVSQKQLLWGMIAHFEFVFYFGHLDHTEPKTRQRQFCFMTEPIFLGGCRLPPQGYPRILQN